MAFMTLIPLAKWCLFVSLKCMSICSLRIKCFLIYVLWEHIKTLNQEPYMHLKLIKLSEPRLLAAWNIYHYFICRIQHFWLQFIAFSHGPFIDITDKKFVNWTLRITSVHGQTAQLPFIKSVEVNFLCHAIVHIFFWNHSLLCHVLVFS